MKIIDILVFMVVCFGSMGLVVTSPLVVETPVVVDSGNTIHQHGFVHCFKNDTTAQDLFDQCRTNGLCDAHPLNLTIERQVGEKKFSTQIVEGTAEDKKILTDLSSDSACDVRVSLSYQNPLLNNKILVDYEKILAHPIIGPIIVFGSFYTTLIYFLIKN